MTFELMVILQICFIGMTFQTIIDEPGKSIDVKDNIGGKFNDWLFKTVSR
jgi:hypothetical protein